MTTEPAVVDSALSAFHATKIGNILIFVINAINKQAHKIHK